MWRIVSDSSCDLHSLPGNYPDIDFVTIPFNITIGSNEYIDNEDIDLVKMMEDNESSPEIAQTACASPEAWSNEFLKGDKILAFTISSALSGSFSSACTGQTMAEEANPDIKVKVVDSKGTGPELAKLIMKACELISSDMDFADERGGNPDLIRVYEGRDGKFTHYLDEGDGYGFENGEYSLVDLTYSEKNHSVSVSKKGNYPMTDDLTIEYIKRPSE